MPTSRYVPAQHTPSANYVSSVKMIDSFDPTSRSSKREPPPPTQGDAPDRKRRAFVASRMALSFKRGRDDDRQFEAKYPLLAAADLRDDSMEDDGGHFLWQPTDIIQRPGQIFCTPSARAPHALDNLVNLALDNCSADKHRGRKHTGVIAWKAFCRDVMCTTPHRPLDPNCPLVVKLEEEWMFMRFACALVETRDITWATLRGYCYAVQGWHAHEHGIKLAAGLKMERLPAMLKGIRRLLGDKPTRIRRGIAPQMLKEAMDKCLDPRNPLHANVRAALAMALQGLLRSAEYCLKSGKTWSNKLHMSRKDIIELTSERMTVMMAPCKNMRHLSGKTCPMVIGAGASTVDAVAEMRNLLAVDPTPTAHANTTPIFRDPSTGEALSYAYMLKIVHDLMLAIGENPDHFGTHSLRIGGATALFAQGADETVIRTMGRWSSDIHKLYVRACFERCVEWTRKAGSAHVTDVAFFDEDGDDDDDDA